MKMNRVAIVVMLLSLSLSLLAQAQEKTTPAAGSTNAVVIKHQTKCPILNADIDKTKFVDQDGTRIYVCCGGCLDAVKKDFPAIKARLEKEGITLDKTPVKSME
jgi:hypothetical protein